MSGAPAMAMDLVVCNKMPRGLDELPQPRVDHAELAILQTTTNRVLIVGHSAGAPWGVDVAALGQHGVQAIVRVGSAWRGTSGGRGVAQCAATKFNGWVE